MMEAVCLMEPQWTMAWYLGEMVVGWCSIRISALELVAALRLQRGVDHHHPLPDLRPLDLLQREACSL